MKKLIVLFLSILFLLFLSGCNDEASRADSYGGGIGDTATESGNQLALAGNDGTLTIDMDGFGGGMGGMGDIDALMNGKEGPPKKYGPRFTMMGEVNVTIDGVFYHLASVYDNEQEVPMSRFMYDPQTHKLVIQVVGVPVWQDRLMSNVKMIIKFPLDMVPLDPSNPRSVDPSKPLGIQPFMQQSTILYPANVQSMVQAGGRPYYWGYLMGGGGYWVVMDENNTQHMAQLAFGAFIMPSRN